MQKGLTTTQLKIIAIIAMVIDHTAWGFVEMFSPLGQIMHVIGRLTIPIMCFFIAEGYRKTSDLNKYIHRMVLFSILTIVPFYLFFGEEYGYRQNFFFDLLLALLVLVVVDNKDIKKGLRVVITVALFAISLAVGGWPVFPMVLVLIFYYVKDFKKQAIIFSSAVVFLVVFMSVTIYFNDVLHFYDPEWRWYQWMYFLGFLLALPLLRLYNGEKGKYPFGRYFFFLFYPGHFLFLYSIKLIMAGNIKAVYLGLHVLVLFIIMIFIYMLTIQKPSRAVNVTILMAVGGLIYTFGFILEVLTGDFMMAYAGTIVEYFGECILLLGFLWFTSEFCKVRVSKTIYALMLILGTGIVYLVATAYDNKFFYKNMGMNYDGPFPRIDLEYGWGFYLFDVYAAIICGIVIFNCVRLIRTNEELPKKRGINLLLAICSPWIAFLIKLTGLTGGYEISSIGALFAIGLIYRAIMKYDFFGSVELASESVIHKFGDGILVVDETMKIQYFNVSMHEMMPALEEGKSVKDYPDIFGILRDEIDTLEIYDKKYHFTVTPLTQKDYLRGYMISSKDMTDHYLRLEQAEKISQRDSLTGLYNRIYFTKLYKEHRDNGGMGCVLMFDLDNFKGVNDSLGHEAGDKILCIVADTLRGISADIHIPCRLGGDEFILYIKDEINRKRIENYCELLIESFARRLEEAGYKNKTSLSIGGRIVDFECENSMEDFAEIYRNADEMLYEAKNSGKATYRIK